MNEVPDGEAFQEPFSLQFVGWYTDVVLENTSVFGIVHDYSRDPSKGVGDSFSLNTTDDDFIADRVPYPERFPDGDGVQTHRKTVSDDD